VSYPVPTPTPQTQHYWDEVREHRLPIRFCRSCQRHYFYARDFCRYCGSADVQWRVACGRARLVSYVINHRVSPAFEPYSPVIALVELDEGVVMMSNIVNVEADPEALKLDMPLQLCFEERHGVVLPVFEPARSA
jgi:uncharacterized OB-fold protein